MAGRPNKVKQLRLGDTVLNHRRAGLSYAQISDRIRRDTGHTLSRQIIGRWVTEHGDNPPDSHIVDDYYEKFRTFYNSFNEYICTECRKVVTIACMLPDDIDNFRYEVVEAKRKHEFDNTMRTKVEMVKKMHRVDI